MADQKKTSPKRGTRSATAKTMPAAHVADIAPEKAKARAARPAAKASEAPTVVSLFDNQLPQEVRTAIGAAKTVTPPAHMLPDIVAPSPAELLDAGTERALQGLARVRSTGEGFRQAMTATAHATTMGALEVNDKVLEALRAQSEAAFELWQTAMKPAPLSETISAQTAAARQVYATAAAGWSEVAESARRWVGATVRPMQSAWTLRPR